MKSEKKSAILHLSGYIFFGLLFMCAAVFIGIYAGNIVSTPTQDVLPVDADTDSTADEGDKEATLVPVKLLVIDPGHGGEDGGASSADGLLEKDLNLALSDNIAHMCLLFGVPYKMTREDDRLLYDYYSELTDYTGKKKSLDLKNRLRLTEEVGAAVFLGIHMNKFSDPKYSGLQVYYSPNNAESGGLAEVVQSYAKAHLQNDNDRQPKKATSSIYLLNRLKIPALLVECGFLSNPAEAQLLGTEDYRAALACSVFTPVLEYYVRIGSTGES